MMQFLKYVRQFLKRLALLNLDVVAGAVLCQYLFWKLPNGKGKVHLPTLLALACSVWLIYTLDRLLDKPQTPTTRHTFHQKNHVLLFSFSIFLTGLLWIGLYFLPDAVIRNGFIFVISTAGYLLIFVYWLRAFWLKELVTALVYTLGVVLPPYWVWGETNVVLAFNILLIALQNLLLMSWFESQQEPQNKNVVLILGSQTTKRLLSICSFWVGLSYFFIENQYSRKIFWLQLLMSVCLLLIILFKRYFETNERYRIWADAVFLLPLILIT